MDRRQRSTIRFGAGLAAALALAAIAIGARTVWLASVRGEVMLAGTAICAAATALLVWRLAMRDRAGGGLRARVLLLFAWLAALAVFVGMELKFRDVRHQVLGIGRGDLARVGRHVMVGYRNLDELRHLVALGAVGGVFVTARNAAGKSTAGLAAEIAALQALARANGHGPLVVATDQEGGMVSRLSPPLPRPRMLAEIAAAEHPDLAARDRAVHAHAVDIGSQLASVGVTLNFAPVADLDFGIRDPADRLSRIGERAIGRDPETVGAVASAYCRGLLAAGVLCTLKHFPGLGRVKGDTHITSASLATPQAELEAADWRPYRAVLGGGEAAIMMAHVVMPALDRRRPASASPAVIDAILRQSWAFEGLVVTDDLTMIGASGGAGGIGAAGVGALAAGADLLLVAYDTDQIYALLAALIGARQQGQLDDALLARSTGRLAKLTGRPPATAR